MEGFIPSATTSSEIAALVALKIFWQVVCLDTTREVPQPASLRLGLPISTQSGTVLFVFRASRFIRRRLNQRRDPRPRGIARGLGGARLLELVLLSVHRQTSAFRRRITFTTDSPWNYDSMVNQPGLVSSLISASTLYTFRFD